MNIFDIKKLLRPIKNRIMLLIGRAILSAINNTGKIQKIKVSGLKGEVMSEVERPQSYGVETSPPLSNTEVIVGAINGNRENGIALIVANHDARPSGLLTGDVFLYDNRGHQIELTVSGIKLKSGDAALWLPNVLAADPFSGAPHGGPTAGIVKLTGG